MIVREYRKFFSEFVSHPRAVGAVCPTSVVLARDLVSSIDWDHTSTVLEYGAGTGAITGQIVSRLPEHTRFCAIEICPEFTRVLHQRFPDACVLEGSVGDVRELCESQGIEQVDAIVCGLPWGAFSEADQNAYLDATMTVLRPGGQFLSYGYLQALLLPAARRFRKKLQDHFSEVRVSKPVWANLPPAFYYRCRR